MNISSDFTAERQLAARIQYFFDLIKDRRLPGDEVLNSEILAVEKELGFLLEEFKIVFDDVLYIK